jgi:putative ABC transport system permease protein
VIGVVRSVHWIGLATRPWATTYFWFPQRPHRQLSIVVRTIGDPGKLARAVALQVRSIDPNQPVADVRALQDFVSADLAQPRFTAVILTGFGTAALLLAGAGLYGVIALWVAQRTREIGVRLALGARRQDVLRLVATRGLRLTALGLAFGIAMALGAGRALTGLLYGVTPADPLTLIGAALFLTCVATGAIYFPARRATRVDPMITLRAE